MAPTKSFSVFDADSHAVEPRDIWEKYLDPEYRTLGRHALWREDGEHGRYLKVNGQIFRDTGNSNIPRHAIWRPGLSWDEIRRDRCRHEARAQPGRLGPQGAAVGHGRDGRRPGVPVPDLVRRGLPPGRRPGRRLRAGARLQRLDGRLLLRRARATFRRRHAAAAEPGLRRRGAAAGLSSRLLPRRFPAAHVHRGPLLHPPLLRPALGRAGAPRSDRGRPPDSGSVEPGVDFPRPVRREGQGPTAPAPGDGQPRRRPFAGGGGGTNFGFTNYHSLGHPVARSSPTGSTTTCSWPRP